MATAVNTVLIKTNPVDEDHVGTQLMRISANLRRDIADLGVLTARMQQMFAANPADYTLIESQMGLSAADSAKNGQAVWGMVNGANTQLAADAAVTKITNWLIANPQ